MPDPRRHCGQLPITATLPRRAGHVTRFLGLLLATVIAATKPAGATTLTIDLDGNGTKESKVDLSFVSGYPLKVRNTVTSSDAKDLNGFTFSWPTAGPGGFSSRVGQATATGPVGLIWEWQTTKTLYPLACDASATATANKCIGFTPVTGTTGRGPFAGVPGSSLSPTSSTPTTASITSSLLTFFSPPQVIFQITSTVTQVTDGQFEFQTVAVNLSGAPVMIEPLAPAPPACGVGSCGEGSQCPPGGGKCCVTGPRQGSACLFDAECGACSAPEVTAGAICAENNDCDPLLAPRCKIGACDPASGTCVSGQLVGSACGCDSECGVCNSSPPGEGFRFCGQDSDCGGGAFSALPHRLSLKPGRGGRMADCVLDEHPAKEVSMVITLCGPGIPAGEAMCADGQYGTSGVVNVFVPDTTVDMPPLDPMISLFGVDVRDSSGDGIVAPGESAQMFVSLVNAGMGGLLNAHAVITPVQSDVDGDGVIDPITVTQGDSPYPDMPGADLSGGSAACGQGVPLQPSPAGNSLPFIVSVPSTHPPDTARYFDLTITGDRNQSGAPPFSDTIRFSLGVAGACIPGNATGGFDTLAGFQKPLADLVPEGGTVPFPKEDFERRRKLHLQLRLACGGVPLTKVAPPKIVALARDGVSIDLGTVDLDADPHDRQGLLFRLKPAKPAKKLNDDKAKKPEWIYDLGTKDLRPGSYVITLQMPNAESYQAGFVMRGEPEKPPKPKPRTEGLLGSANPLGGFGSLQRQVPLRLSRTNRPAQPPPCGTPAELSVTKTDGVEGVVAGGGVTYTYTISVNNSGPSAAEGVGLSDTWPAGFTQGTIAPSQGTCTPGVGGSFTCLLGTINAGSNATVAVTYTVPAATAAGTQTNTVTVTSTNTQPEQNTADNTASDTNIVVPVGTGLTGIWNGTYSWDCGGGRSGSTAITFGLTQSGTTLSGTAVYLGSTTPIIRSSVQGTSVRIEVAGTTTHVNNEFTGTLSGSQIAGTTLNGDTPGGGAGCSANTGPSGTFTVTRPIFDISPNSGPAGQPVTVSGSGFAPGSAIAILYDGAFLGFLASTDTAGNIVPFGFTVPPSPVGVHSVRAVDNYGNEAPSRTYTVATPIFDISPNSGPAGQPVTVSGSGFAPGSAIAILYDGASLGFLASTDTAGNIVPFSFTVPPSPVGDHSVGAVDNYGNQAPSRTYTVTPPTLFGLTDYEVVQASTTTGAVGTVGSVFVVCPGTKKVLGGGYWTPDGNEDWRVWRNYAVDEGGLQTGDRGWGLTFTSVQAGQLVWVRAVCASVPTELGYEVVQANATTGAVGTLGSVSVVCPGTKKVLGGGYLSTDGIEDWRVWRNRAVDEGGVQTGDRGWGLDFTSVLAGRSVWVRAVCASVPAELGYEVVQASATTGAVGTLGSVSVVCTGTKKVLGGGYWTIDGIENWRVWRNRAVDEGGVQTGDRGWGLDFTSVQAGRSVWVGAVCASVTTATAQSKTVFITSVIYPGTLGGLSGADARCNERAVAAGLAGNYKAWLSDSTGSPNTRFTRNTGPYLRTDGVQIASGYTDLTDGSLAASINIDEFGVPIPGGERILGAAWTYTLGNGDPTLDPALSDCQDWTSGSPFQGFKGSPYATDSCWTTGCFAASFNCGSQGARLYCMEQ